MKDSRKTKAQLIDELVVLRRRVSKLEERLGADPGVVSRPAEADEHLATDQPVQEELSTRERAEQALRESERRYRAIVEDQTELICRWLPGGTHTFANDAYCRAFGKSAEELIGQSLMLLIPQEDHEKALLHFNSLCRAKPVATHEHRVIAAGGDIRWHQWTDRALFDAKGEIVEYQSVGRDITKRKRAEEESRESEEQLRLITDNVTALIAYVGADRRYHFVNKQYEMWHGLPREEIVGRHVKDILGDANYKAIEEHLDAALSGRHVSFETPMEYREGKTRWVNATYVPHSDATGRIVGFHALINDISQRKRAEEELRESEERYRALFEQAADAVLLINTETGALVEFNDRAYQNLGYTRQEFQNLTVADIEVIESPEEIAEHIARVLKEGTDTFETKHRTKSGEIRDVRVTNRVIPVRGKSLFQTIWTDITEGKQMEETLRQGEERLRFLLAASPAVIYTCHPASDYADTFMSENVKALLGYEAREFLDDPRFWADHIHQEDAPRVFAELPRLFEHGHHTHEYRFRRKDGTYRWMRDEMRLVRDADNDPREIVGYWVDITEHRRAEEELRESEERHRSLTDDVLESSAVGIFILDAGFRVVWVNQAMADYFGLRRENVVGRNKWQLIQEQIKDVFEHPDAFAEKVLATYDDNTYIENFECHVLPSGDREERWLEHRSRPIHSGLYAGGRIEHYYDITGHKRAVEALRDSEQRFRTVVTASKDAMVAVGEDGLVTLFNTAAERMLGRPASKVLGQTLDCLMPQEYRGAHRKYVEEYFTRGEPHGAIGQTLELTAQRSDGRQFPIELSLSIGEQGGRRFALAVIRDITKRKAVQDELRRAHEGLEQRVRDRTADLTAANRQLQQEITERQRVEEALRESEERFRTIFQNAPIGVYRTTPDGRIINVNPALATMLGYASSEELARRNLEQEGFEPEYARSQFRERMERHGAVTGMEAAWKRRDGSLIFVRENARAIRDAQGTIRYYDGTVEDITDRKAAERALHHRIEFETLIAATSTRFINLPTEAVDQGIERALQEIGQFAGVDRSYVFQYFNQATRMTNTHEWCAEGISRARDRLQDVPVGLFAWFTEHMKRHEVVHVPRVADLPADAAAEKTEWQAEDIQSLISAPMVCAGSLIGFVGFDSVRQEKTWPDEIVALLRIFGEILANAIERKRAEEALRDSEERFRRLSEAAHEGIAINEQGTILDANVTLARMFGYEPPEIIGRDALEFVAPESRDLVRSQTRTQSDTRYDAVGLRKDGTRFPIEIRGKTMPYHGRTVRVEAIRDLTERVQAEKALRRADRLASLGTAVAGVAHELNNPLTSICGLAELLAREPALTTQAQGVADEIVQQGVRCSRIVEDLLGFAQARPVAYRPVQVNEVVRRCLDLARKARRFDDVEIIEQYEPQLPTVHADPYRLEQVFNNIIRNASDALRPCRSIRQLTVQTTHCGEQIQVIFTDNGPGIADPSRVFDPFYSTKPTGEGAGLGLSVSHGIVQEHGGNITAENLPVGTRFTIRLPVRPPSSVEE